MTKFLATPDNPDGWRLEDILEQIQNDIFRRSIKIMEDARPEARAVLDNNIAILGMLAECVKRAKESTRIVQSFGPHSAASGPRIGTA